jgi:dTMP kinase
MDRIFASDGADLGVFITLEGGEGTGKTTQAELLRARLEEAGHDVHLFREPGGTELGDEIRRLLLDPSLQHPFPRAELLLYEASRAQLVEREILPRLRIGSTVLCDRFTDSTLAYQAYARDLDVDFVRSLNDWAAHGVRPDLTIVLDTGVDLAMERATFGGADRLELELDEFHQRVRAGFHQIAQEEPERVKVVDADQPRGAVSSKVWDAVAALLDARGLPR